jgi:hypothetical protein
MITSRKMRRAFSACGGEEECIQDFGGKSRRKEISRWEHNIKIDLREIVWGVMNWINLVQNTNKWRAIVNTVMNIRVP